MKIIFLGDIVGNPGRDAVKQLLPGLRREHSVDFAVANAENAAGGSGITQRVADELFSSGLDVLTSGDHIWKKKDIFELIRQEQRIIRPANYPIGAPGMGWHAYALKSGAKIGVVNLLGRVFLEPMDCPFAAAMKALEELKKETNLIMVDMHAEATSEKIAMGWYLNGLVSAVMGTHTHIQTADERILPGGTAYITDVGMTGPYDSVIGRRVEDVLSRFITCVPIRFEVAEANVQLHGALVEIDDKTGKALSITRIQRKLE